MDKIIHSPIKYVLSTFSMLGVLLGPGNTVPMCSSKECRKGPVLVKLILRGGVRDMQ